jgi:putative hydrolase of HD superfamily
LREKDQGTEGLIDFLSTVGRLKRLRRTGWVESGVGDPESVADHSFRTAVLAMVLADLDGLDSAKTMRMALLHDLAEAETGDLTPDQKMGMGAAYASEERRALKRCLSTLPRALSARYSVLLVEYNRRESAEARVVTQADRLEMLLQALEYEESGVEGERLERFWLTDVPDGFASQILDGLREKLRLMRNVAP